MRLHLLGVRLQMGDLSRPAWVVAIVLAVVILASSRRWLRYVAAAGSLAAIAVALIAMARRAPPMPPVGDVGVIEIYIFDALKGRLLVGPYSHFLWHHPGPVYFYMLAPFYALSGYLSTGAAAGALAINIAAVALLAWTARRVAGRPTALLLTAACLFYALRFTGVVTSQWNPHVLVLPFMALVVVAAAITVGRSGLIPAFVALGSFIAQTHLGLAPSVAAMSMCAFGACVWRTRTQPDARRTLWWQMNAGLWVTAILWLPALVDQMTRPQGNLGRLWTFFAGGSTGQPFLAALAAWSSAISGAVRPGFVLAWGLPMDTRVQIVPVLMAVALAAALVWTAFTARREGRRFHAALSSLLLVASGVALLSASRIAGDIVDHEVFWMSGLGALAAAVIAGEAARLVMRGPVRERTRWLSARPGDVVCAALIAVFVWRGAANLNQLIEGASNPGNEEVAAGTLFEEIEKYDRMEGRPKLRIDIDGPAWPVAAAVVVQLERAGVPFGVMPAAAWMFGDATSVDGTETRTILISRAAAHDEATGKGGAVPIAERRGFYADLVTREP